MISIIAKIITAFVLFIAIKIYFTKRKKSTCQNCPYCSDNCTKCQKNNAVEDTAHSLIKNSFEKQ